MSEGTGAPHQVGTGANIGRLAGDPPEVQTPISWDDNRTLAIMATAGNLFRKLTDDHLMSPASSRSGGEPQQGSRPLVGVELQELVHAAQRGDPLAISALLRAVAPYVGRICGAIALQDGDDAMQETLIQLFKHLGSLREPAALQGWLRRTAVREALRLARARARQVPVEQVAERATEDGAGLRLEVAETLRRLSPDQRAVLVLRDLEGFSEAEAAALLRIELGTAKSRLHRARRAFRNRWRP